MSTMLWRTIRRLVDGEMGQMLVGGKDCFIGQSSDFWLDPRLCPVIRHDDILCVLSHDFDFEVCFRMFHAESAKGAKFRHFIFTG
jgi:hypothetical protein